MIVVAFLVGLALGLLVAFGVGYVVAGRHVEQWNPAPDGTVRLFVYDATAGRWRWLS